MALSVQFISLNHNQIHLLTWNDKKIWDESCTRANFHMRSFSVDTLKLVRQFFSKCICPIKFGHVLSCTRAKNQRAQCTYYCIFFMGLWATELGKWINKTRIYQTSTRTRSSLRRRQSNLHNGSQKLVLASSRFVVGQIITEQNLFWSRIQKGLTDRKKSINKVDKNGSNEQIYIYLFIRAIFIIR